VTKTMRGSPTTDKNPGLQHYKSELLEHFC